MTSPQNDLLALAKKSDQLLSRLIQVIHSYQSHISSSYRPSTQKLKEAQSHAVQLSVEIAENAIGPLLEAEMEWELSQANSQKSLHNSCARQWNKLLVQGIFLSVTCMMGAMWKKGLIVAFVAGVAVMFLWIWITGWWTGLTDGQRDLQRLVQDTEDPEAEAKRMDDLISRCATDDEIAQHWSNRESSAMGSVTSLTHTLYLRRLSVMNNALAYMTKLETIPEKTMQSLLEAPSVEKVYVKSMEERSKRKGVSNANPAPNSTKNKVD